MDEKEEPKDENKNISRESFEKRSETIPSTILNAALKRPNNEEITNILPKKQHLEMTPEPKTENANISKYKHSPKFRYGNYDRYYGYRNIKDFKDVRLEAFKQHKDLFDGKDLLDIGCNNGLVTMEIAKNFNIKSITGIDIDRKLIGRAIHTINTEKKVLINSNLSGNTFPYNILFKHCDYVLSDPALLDLEKPQFNTILCLSVTKWIHLNNGDNGLKLAFRRMFKQLRPGGRLILEAQNWQSYKRRKKLTSVIFEHFQSIKLQPNQFDDYLIGPDVGFSHWYQIEVIGNSSKGFQRPIKVFVKPNDDKVGNEE